MATASSVPERPLSFGHDGLYTAVALLEPGPLVLDRVLGYCAMLLASGRAERVQGRICYDPAALPAPLCEGVRARKLRWAAAPV